MKELLEYIAKHLVDNPDAVVVTERASRSAISLQLTVGEGDAGKVIGRGGRVAKAIRDLVSVAAARQNKRVHIDIE